MQTFEEECEEVVESYCKYSIVLLFYVLLGSFVLLNTTHCANITLMVILCFKIFLYNIFQFFYCLTNTVR